MVLQIGVDSKRLQVHENLYRAPIHLLPNRVRPDQVLVPLFRHWQPLLLCTKFLYNPCSPNPYAIRAPLCSPIRNRHRHNHRYSRHHNYHYRSYR
jgi:hypothetical protein